MFGFGVRSPHYGRLLAEGPPVPLMEIIAENFVDRGGRARAVLERVRRDSDVVLHGVSMSLGSVDPLDITWLQKLRELADRVEPLVVSDHACFTGAHGWLGHDLWPLPYNEATVAHVVARVQRAQDILGRRIALENVSSYVSFAASDMTEHEFLSEVATRADCFLLLDLNNVVVNAANHRFSPEAFIDALPPLRIVQAHLAGHSDRGTYLFDDHGSDVPEELWTLYRRAIARCGPLPTLIERDDRIPSLEELTRQAARIPLEQEAALRIDDSVRLDLPLAGLTA